MQPDLIPGHKENRLVMNLIADFLFVASFFILGGDFWDKFRALFIYEAKAQIPERKSAWNDIDIGLKFKR